jgi:hypothetical protein
MTAYSAIGADCRALHNKMYITYQRAEDKNDVDNHEHLNRCETVGFGDVACDTIEDVDEDEEDSDENGHSTRDTLGRYKKAGL